MIYSGDEDCDDETTSGPIVEDADDADCEVCGRPTPAQHLDNEGRCSRCRRDG